MLWWSSAFAVGPLNRPTASIMSLWANVRGQVSDRHDADDDDSERRQDGDDLAKPPAVEDAEQRPNEGQTWRSRPPPTTTG